MTSTRNSCTGCLRCSPVTAHEPQSPVALPAPLSGAPSPAIDNGFITFGSCNNLGKLTDEVLALWGRVLEAVPHSRLLIEGKNFDRPEFAQAYRDRCEGLGLPPSRLELVPLNQDNQYLTYHRIDIALDPFPLTGGTTTFDVLWMAVPIVSMMGESFKSRMGVGMLSYLGRKEWLAESRTTMCALLRAWQQIPRRSMRFGSTCVAKWKTLRSCAKTSTAGTLAKACG